MAIYNKATERTLGGQTKVGIEALSQRAGDYRVAIGAGSFTQNATTRAGTAFVVPYPMTLRAASLACETLVVASGGTLSTRIVVKPTGTAVSLTDTIDPQAMTSRLAVALVLASTNVILAAGDVVQIENVASNHTVGTAVGGFGATLIFTPAEQSVLDY